MPEDVFCSWAEFLKLQGLDPAQVAGIPTWMAIAGVILILLVSHGLVDGRAGAFSRWRYGTFNLLGFGPVKQLVRQPWFPMLAQSLSLLTLLLILSAGLFGHEKNNIAPVLTWTWWWALLIFLVLGLGQTFCMICPWEALSSLVTSLSFKSRVKKLGFELAWPKWMRRIYPALFLFFVLTWFELGFDVTHSPMLTAVLAMAMIGMAVLSAMIFERRAFCRNACLVGRITGMYSLFSPVELRPQSTDICRTCQSKACYQGTETEVGCPTGLFPGHLQENTYCTLCTECVRSCPHDNMALQLRPPGADLLNKARFQWDEAWLAVILLSLTSFHGLTMTPQWTRLNQVIRVETGWGQGWVFTMLMVGVVLATVALFWVGARVAAGSEAIETGRIFKAFAYSLIPIALFYHLAHNCMHFFLEAGSLIPLLSDPFGWGWDLFGTAGMSFGPLLSWSTIWWLQIICIVVGHVFGVIVASRVARRLFADTSRRVLSLIPLLITMILFSCFSVWLIAQPMDMRSGF